MECLFLPCCFLHALLHLSQSAPAGASGAAPAGYQELRVKVACFTRSHAAHAGRQAGFLGRVEWTGRRYINKDVPGGQLPYTAAGQAAYQDNMTKAVDPQSLCVLIGQPRADLDGQVFEIFQTPQRIAFLYERDDAWRTGTN